MTILVGEAGPSLPPGVGNEAEPISSEVRLPRTMSDRSRLIVVPPAAAAAVTWICTMPGVPELTEVAPLPRLSTASRLALDTPFFGVIGLLTLVQAPSSGELRSLSYSMSDIVGRSGARVTFVMVLVRFGFFFLTS